MCDDHSLTKHLSRWIMSNTFWDTSISKWKCALLHGSEVFSCDSSGFSLHTVDRFLAWNSLPTPHRPDSVSPGNQLTANVTWEMSQWYLAAGIIPLVTSKCSYSNGLSDGKNPIMSNSCTNSAQTHALSGSLWQLNNPKHSLIFFAHCQLFPNMIAIKTTKPREKNAISQKSLDKPRYFQE